MQCLNLFDPLGVGCKLNTQWWIRMCSCMFMCIFCACMVPTTGNSKQMATPAGNGSTVRNKMKHCNCDLTIGYILLGLKSALYMEGLPIKGL